RAPMLASFSRTVAHSRPLPFPTRRSSDLGLARLDAGDDLDAVAEPIADLQLARAQVVALDDEYAVDAVAVLNRVVRQRHHLVDSDRKSTRLNSSHVKISYAVFCLKKRRTP